MGHLIASQMRARQKCGCSNIASLEREERKKEGEKRKKQRSAFEPCNLHVPRTRTTDTCPRVVVNETHTEADWSVEAVWSSAGCRRGRCCCPPRPGNIGRRSPSSGCARSRVWSTRPASVCRSASLTWKDVAGSSPRSLSGDTWRRTGLREENTSLWWWQWWWLELKDRIDNGSKYDVLDEMGNFYFSFMGCQFSVISVCTGKIDYWIELIINCIIF